MDTGYWLIGGVVLAVLLAGCVPEVPEDTDFGKGGLAEPPARSLPKSLNEYQASIDYSCGSDSDCVIKDVGNCCGFYPRCVNSEAETNPDLVSTFCAEQQMVSVCGFPSISSCECISGTCVGKE